MLIKHSVLYLFARGLPGLIGFLSIAVFTRLLSPETYGRYALVVAGVGFFNVVFFQWLRLALLRFMPSYLDNQSSLMRTIQAAFVGIVILTGIIALGFCLLWPDSTWRVLLFLAIPLLWGQAWFELNLELFRSRLKPLCYGAASGFKSVTALVVGTVLAVFGLGAYGPLIGLITSYLLAGLGFLIIDWRGIRPMVDRPVLGQILRYGAPFTATFALDFVVSTSDRFLIAYFIGEGAAGVYSATYDLGQQTLILLMMVVNLAAYPLAVRALEQRGVEAAQRQLATHGTLLLGVSVPATVGFAVLANNITGLLLGPDFHEESARLLPWVVLAILLLGVRLYYFNLAFQLGQHTSAQVWIAGPVAVLNLVLNLWWIPLFGLLGAVFATFVAYLGALVLSIILGRRVFPLPLPFRDWIWIILASLLMGLLLLPTVQYYGLTALLLQIFLGVSVYTVWLVIFDVGGCRTKVLRRKGS